MPDPALPGGSERPATRGAALESALAALDRLAALGEDVEDEWTYVMALAEAGRTRLRAAAGPDPDAALAPAVVAAVTAAADEAARIVDPHRAIDWLSTFPAVVELVLAVEPSAARSSQAPRAAGSTGPAGEDA